jgi:MSHA biogenesis protein MshG
VSTFRYTARGADGGLVSGEIEAANPRQAAAQIAERGAIPLQISSTEAGAATEATGAARVLRVLPFGRRVSLSMLAMLARQMHTMTRSGVPMIRALRSIADTSRDSLLAGALARVADSLQAGRDLANSLALHPNVFPRLFVNTVRVGEATGRLEQSFDDLAKYLEREDETIKRIKSALRYPTMVIVAVAASITVINVFVVPAFARMFESMQAELPLPTRLLIGSSNFMVSYWPYLLVAALGAIVGVQQWLQTDAGRYLWHRYRMRIPVVGPVLERATLARFARGFAMASRAGIPVIETLSTVGQALDNEFVRERVGMIRERIGRGESLTSASASSGLFTPLVLQMIGIGEESGSVDDMLDEVAGFYEREVDHDLRTLSDAIEPILIVLLGGIVLMLALAVYLPMWELASAARGGR